MLEDSMTDRKPNMTWHKPKRSRFYKRLQEHTRLGEQLHDQTQNPELKAKLRRELDNNYHTLKYLEHE